MNPQVKEAWVAALRSGKYEQGTNALKRTSLGGRVTYCCLGVLCEVLQLVQVTKEPVIGRPDRLTEFWDDEQRSQFGVPQSTLARIELELAIADKAADMNDSGTSFSTIADYLERAA